VGKLVRFNQIMDKLDEFVAVVFAVGGLIYIFMVGEVQTGLAIAAVGTSYLFGKNVPKK